MTEQALAEDSTLITTEAPATADSEGSGASVHPVVLAWFDEAKRLFEEAEERLESGAVLPALSSLAAVPPLHGMLMGRCSEMLDPTEVDDMDDIDDMSDTPTGMYL